MQSREWDKCLLNEPLAAALSVKVSIIADQISVFGAGAGWDHLHFMTWRIKICDWIRVVKAECFFFKYCSTLCEHH